MPSVEPAFDLAGFEDELDASVFPAFESTAFEGFDDRDDFAISVLLVLEQGRHTPVCLLTSYRRLMTVVSFVQADRSTGHLWRSRVLGQLRNRRPA